MSGALRLLLVPYRWTSDIALVVTVPVVLGVVAARNTVGTWAVPSMTTDDYAWSFLAVAALITSLGGSLTLVDRLPAWTALAARDLTGQRLLNAALVTAFQCWPVALLVWGVSTIFVTGCLSQSLLMLAAGAWAGRLRPWFAALPAALGLVLAVLPGVLPVSVHPIVPAQHPVWLVSAGMGLAVVLLIAWVVIPPSPRR